MTDPARTLRDAAYIGIGFGVLAFQRAQVQRQAIKKQLDAQLGDARGGFSKLSESLEDRVKLLEERFEGVQEQIESVLGDVEAGVDRALDELTTLLPEPARDALVTARSAARDATTHLWGRVA